MAVMLLLFFPLTIERHIFLVTYLTNFDSSSQPLQLTAGADLCQTAIRLLGCGATRGPLALDMMRVFVCILKILMAKKPDDS